MPINPQYIGDILLKSGFETWFRYMFRMVEGRAFTIDPIHKDLFVVFDDIYNLRTIRQTINLPPRSSKTTLCKYFICYCWAINPKCNFIYTSYSQSLLNDIAREIAGILESPIYKAMHPFKHALSQENISAIDGFWDDYFQEIKKSDKKDGKSSNDYSSKKITTYAGGVCVFASVGSQLTGFGAGVRGINGFGGCLIMDDLCKPSNMLSVVLREKTNSYFSNTLISRLNHAMVPILNVQQRLHLEDITGYLQANYNFNMLVKPLLDENGVCQVPSQYTEQYINELKVNDYDFEAQYMQRPIRQGGGVFKVEWWRFYNDTNLAYRRIFITADTAMKTKEYNDFTAIGVWGLTQSNQLYLLDMVHGKFEAPELESVFLGLWNKWKNGINGRPVSAVYIEDKASGTGLIQSLRRQGGMPILAFIPEKDKLTRANDVVGYVASGNVYLPNGPTDPISKIFLDELTAFSSDMSAPHDDIVDMTTSALNQAYNQRGLF